jgi:hypothetical protein
MALTALMASVTLMTVGTSYDITSNNDRGETIIRHALVPLMTCWEEHYRH